ncbi:MAG: hypothetical protein U0354_01185 [Candidatus Sericytochromatia bacterium]
MSRLLLSKYDFDGELTLILNNNQYLFKGCKIKITYYESSDTIETFDMILKIEDDSLRKTISKEIKALDIKSPTNTYFFSMRPEKLLSLGEKYRKNLESEKLLKVDNMACFYLDNYDFVSYEEKS